MTDKRSKSVVSIILDRVAFPLFMLVSGGIAIIESNRLDRKYPQEDWWSGPSSFMKILGFIMLVLCLVEAVKAVLGIRKDIRKMREQEAAAESGQKAEKDAKDKEYTKVMLISFAMVLVYIFIIKYTGFALATVIYLTANLVLLKNPPLRIAITAVVILALLLWGAPAMGISLPRGFLGF